MINYLRDIICLECPGGSIILRFLVNILIIYINNNIMIITLSIVMLNQPQMQMYPIVTLNK